MINQVKQVIIQYPIIISFICAELFLLLARNSVVMIILKKDSHRIKKEKLQIEQGLKREIIIEAILFVPASVVLFRLTVFPLIFNILLKINQDKNLWYAITGIAAYGFPFATIREFIRRIALKTLKEFSLITIKNEIDGNDNK